MNLVLVYLFTWLYLVIKLFIVLIKGDNTNPLTYYSINAARICKDGYTGILCNECSDNYGKVNATSCE